MGKFSAALFFRKSVPPRWAKFAFPSVLLAVAGSVGCGVAGSLSSSPSVPPQLTANPTIINFGNVAMDATSTQTVILTNSGSASLTISQKSVTGPGFSISGLPLPLTLTAGQSSAFNAQFTPPAVGSVIGSVSLVSNASNSPTTIALSGSGFQPVPHSVILSWTASPSVVVGYNVYRATQSGGPYTKLNSTPVAAISYADDTVQSGQTYFYVATAVDANNVESVSSNEASATTPMP